MKNRIKNKNPKHSKLWGIFKPQTETGRSKLPSIELSSSNKNLQYGVLSIVLILFVGSLFLLFSGPVSFWQAVFIFAILILIAISGIISYNYKSKIKLEKVYKINLYIFLCLLIVSVVEMLVNGMNYVSLLTGILSVLLLIYYIFKVKR